MAVPLVVAASVAAGTAATAVGATAVASEYSQAQCNGLGEGAEVGVLAEAPRNTPWVLVWENWWHGRFFQVFTSREDALARSESGGKLRRALRAARHAPPGMPAVFRKYSAEKARRSFGFARITALE